MLEKISTSRSHSVLDSNRSRDIMYWVIDRRYLWFINCTTHPRLHFVNRYIHGVRDGEVDPVHILFHCETRFQRDGYMNYQSESFPVLMHEVLIHRNNWRIIDQPDVTIYYVLFHFFYAQHVSDINTSIISGLRLFYCMTTLVMCSCFDVCWSFGVSGWGGIRVAGWSTRSLVCSVLCVQRGLIVLFPFLII